MSAFKVIFLDWYNTCSLSRFWESDQPDEQAIFDLLQTHFIKSRRDLLDAWQTASLSSEDIHDWLATQFNLNRDTLWNQFVRSCQTMRLEDGLSDQLHAVKKNHKLILATDNMDSFRRFTIPSLKLDELFDDIMISSELGLMKTHENGRVFQQRFEQHQVQPSDCLFIDDSAKTCEVFRALGGIAWVTESPSHTVKLLQSLN